MSPTRHVPSLPRSASLATLFAALLAGCTDESQPTGPADLHGPRPSIAAVASATNGKIAFVSFRDGNGEIYLMNADGSGPTNLTNNRAHGAAPAWSPDGTKLAFTRADEIYVMNADGSGQTNLTNNPAVDRDPAWSPDGTKIAFVSRRDNPFGFDNIYVMNVDGSAPTRLTGRHDFSPAWSPEGTKLAFVSTRDLGFEIYVMNADGFESGVTRLTNNSLFDHDDAPAWSPDGTKIAFSCDRTGANVEICVMNADGSGQTNLTNHLALDNEPAWSPDGTKIAFTSHRDGNFEIYVMNADGSGLTNLTNDLAADFAPAWQPLLQSGQSVYRYSGNNFNSFSCGGPQLCPVPDPAFTSYKTSDHVTAVLTLNSPLPAGLNLHDVRNLPGFSLTMTDGHQVLTQLPDEAMVSTDADGNIVGPWSVIVSGSPFPGNGITSVNWPGGRGVGDLGALSSPNGLFPDTPLNLGTVSLSPGVWTTDIRTPEDVEPPVLTVPADMTVEATSATGAVVTYSASATDDVDPAPVVSCDTPSGATFLLGSTVVTCTATDAAGNTATASFVVTVVDTTAPVLSLPADLAVDATSPSGAVVSYTVSATDVASVPSVSCTPASGTLFAIGTHTVSCTATDASGNATAGSFVVTVKGAEEQITDLQGAVTGLDLEEGTETSLEQKLAAASSALARDERGAACGLLQALIDQVNAQSDKKISAADAAVLIAEAERIRAVLGC